MVTQPIMLACQRAGSEPYRVEVDANVFGAWAAHASVNGLGYKVTFLRFGLATPFDFDCIEDASAVAEEIDALKQDWSGVTVEDIKSMAPSLIAICKRNSGLRIGTAIFRGKPRDVAELPERAK